MSKSEVHSTAVIGESGTRGSIIHQIRELAGYQLLEQIGVGGYGEVWSALGPGGFKKAVKILFGAMNGPQAETELKALQHMRELRHPFLLNIERIEIIEDRLIVVTELADSSLDKRFQQCVAGGGRGIPRDELLSYLRDAADALDFMTLHHGMQHLDIKPENLMIQGNHIKVGDFGLAKHISQTGSASLVRGFTPLYSPPELFEGQPSRTSDQYSLAIVYQIMLTGVSPFNGRTAAQLTAQHLKSAPDLTALSATERGVVSRALSKNPSSRFPGCRQFIDELSRRRHVSSAGIRRNPSSENDTSKLTQFVDTDQAPNVGIPATRSSKPLAPPEVIIGAEFRPTLFIAVGGLGIRVADSLRSKLRDQFGTQDIPSFGFLYIDSDRDHINSTLRSDISETKSFPISAVPITLRTTQDYRKSASDHLSWISRRWLFNIPRSGQVEGMRPLGRLAFVDHQARIRDAIKSVLARLGLRESVAASTAVLGGPVSYDHVDICLIGSVSGGTSSGCLMDIAYLARTLVGFSSFRRADISAMLVHSTSIGQHYSDTQDANATSFLKELMYYSLPGNTTPAGIPEPAPGQPRGPFDTTYFIHLGDDLTNTAYSHQVDEIASYLHLWSSTEVRQQLETWRRLEKDSTDTPVEASIRTFGHASILGEAWKAASRNACVLAARIAARWLDSAQMFAARRPPVKAEGTVALLLDSMHISDVRSAELIPALLRGDVGKRLEQYSAELWNRVAKKAEKITDYGPLTELLNSVMNADAAAPASAGESVSKIVDVIRSELRSRLQNSQSELLRQLSSDLDEQGRFYSAFMTLAACGQATERALAACARQKDDVQKAFAGLCNDFAAAAKTLPASQDGACQENGLARSFARQYCLLLLCQAIAQSAIDHLNELRALIRRTETETMSACQHGLREIVRSSGQVEESDAEITDAAMDAFETWLRKQGQFRLSHLLDQGDQLATISGTFTADAMKFLLNESQSEGEQGAAQSMAPTFPANAHPVIRRVGGGRRVLALLPGQSESGEWVGRLEAEFGACVVAVPMKRDDISVYCEHESIPIPCVVDSLTSLRPRVAELSERVHSRHDVVW